jgi:hypothetical protein
VMHMLCNPVYNLRTGSIFAPLVLKSVNLMSLSPSSEVMMSCRAWEIFLLFPFFDFRLHFLPFPPSLPPVLDSLLLDEEVNEASIILGCGLGVFVAVYVRMCVEYVCCWKWPAITPFRWLLVPHA